MSKKRYAPRTPRTANGFRAQDLKAIPRGAWWTKGWLSAIEDMRLGARAGRGKGYAELGQVVSLSVSATHVEAEVLGARPDPYTVKIDFAPAVTPPEEGAPADAGGIFGEMTLGRILVGEMPSVVEEFFSKEGISPYPEIGTDRFWCSCPDWSKPCKHIAAVLYLLGDAMVRDPSLLLRIRGIGLSGSSECSDAALPLWKGAEKLDAFITRIRRRVQRR